MIDSRCIYQALCLIFFPLLSSSITPQNLPSHHQQNKLADSKMGARKVVGVVLGRGDKKCWRQSNWVVAWLDGVDEEGNVEVWKDQDGSSG